MKRFLLIILSVVPVAGDAQDWPLRDSDRPFSAKELESLSKRSFVFFDDGESIYGEDGAYSYTYSAANGGGTAWGTYRIEADGSVCVDFTNGAMRCDLLVHDGTRVVMLTQDGERFPVR